MLKVSWKVLVFLSVVNTLLFLCELMAMWLMVGLDGVIAVFNRRSQGLIDVTFEISTLAIGLLWLPTSQISFSKFYRPVPLVSRSFTKRIELFFRLGNGGTSDVLRANGIRQRLVPCPGHLGKCWKSLRPSMRGSTTSTLKNLALY